MDETMIRDLYRNPRLAVVLAIALCSCTIVSAAEVPLADAAERADWPRVRSLLMKKTDANAGQADGMTALHWATQHDHLEALKLLLAAGANAKAENRYGVTPLS